MVLTSTCYGTRADKKNLQPDKRTKCIGIVFKIELMAISDQNDDRFEQFAAAPISMQEKSEGRPEASCGKHNGTTAAIKKKNAAHTALMHTSRSSR